MNLLKNREYICIISLVLSQSSNLSREPYFTLYVIHVISNVNSGAKYRNSWLIYHKHIRTYHLNCGGFSLRIQTEIDKIVEQMSELEILVKNLIDENSSKALNRDAFQKKYNSYKKRYESLEIKLNESKGNKNTNLRKLKGIELFIQNLNDAPALLKEWDASIWIKLVEKAVIQNDRTIKFILYSSKEICTVI